MSPQDDIMDLTQRILPDGNAWDKLERAINTTAGLTNTALNIVDRVVPNKTNQELVATRKIIVDLATQQSENAAKQIAATLQHATATSSQTKVLEEGLSTLAKAQMGIVKEALQSVPKDELATISTEIRGLRKELRSIANDLVSFTKPSVFGQLMDVGALLTSTAAVAHIKRLADQAERMANSLDRISDNVYSENSRGDKFPTHIHSYVRSMIEQHHSDQIPHYFFIFNPSTTWYAKFDDINRVEPLGDHYLGRRHDLDELVAFIVESARPRLGPEPVIHILIPTISQLAITESLRFPDEMGPFRIDGQLGESGLPFAYLCAPENEEHLHHIGALRPRPRWVLHQTIGIPLVCGWELEPVYFEDPYLTTMGTVSAIFYGSVYHETHPVPPRTLGRLR